MFLQRCGNCLLGRDDKQQHLPSGRAQGQREGRPPLLPFWTEASPGRTEALSSLRNHPTVQHPTTRPVTSSVTPSRLDFWEAHGRPVSTKRGRPPWAELPEESGQLRAVGTHTLPSPPAGPHSSQHLPWGLPLEFLSPWLPLVERASCSEKGQVSEVGVPARAVPCPTYGTFMGSIVLRHHHQGAQERRAHPELPRDRLGAAAKVRPAVYPPAAPRGGENSPSMSLTARSHLSL